jgi:hypothetical protein
LGKERPIVRSRKLLAAALLAGLVLAGCTDDDPEAAPKTAPIKLVQFGPADVISPVAGMRPLDAAVAKAAMRTTQRFFDASVRDPLLTGKRGAIKPFFTGLAAKRATGADRAVLFDLGLPRVRTLKSTSQVVQLTGYAGEDNQVALVVAKLAWDVKGDGKRVRVVHRGELTLVPAFGGWFVDGYDITTTRTVGGTTTTSSAEKK